MKNLLTKLVERDLADHRVEKTPPSWCKHCGRRVHGHRFGLANVCSRPECAAAALDQTA